MCTAVMIVIFLCEIIRAEEIGLSTGLNSSMFKSWDENKHKIGIRSSISKTLTKLYKKQAVVFRKKYRTIVYNLIAVRI